jgi:diacylglycerol kinase (ATP)
MRVKVVMNPWSDQRRAIRQKDILQVLQQRYAGMELVLTERPGHGRDLAQAAAEADYDLVAAAGGDGTLHEVVNGLMRGGNGRTRLGVIPIGTGNDFAFALGISSGDVAAAVDRLYHGQPRFVDLGRVEDDRGQYAYFANNLGIGTDAVVVIRSEAITRLHGFLLYIVAVMQTIAFYYRSLGLEIRFDDEEVKQDALLLALGIGPRHGGGFLLTPSANQSDDLIDSCLARPMSRLNMLQLVIRSMKGKHVASPRVVMRQNRQIQVKSNMPLPIHIDGEMFAYPQDDVRQLRINSVPAAVQVMV